MKSNISIAAVLMVLSLSSCNSCNNEEERKYEVMQRYGGWQARMDESRNKAKHIEDHFREYDAYVLNEDELKAFSTEYPFWQQVELHSYDGSLKRAMMEANPEKGERWEKLYFNESKLIYAAVCTGDSGASRNPDEQYIFEQGALVFALDGNNEKRDIESDAVKLSGIDLMKEAKQLLTVHSKNKYAN